MVNAENNNPGFTNEVNKLITKDYNSGIIQIRNMFLDNGIYEEGKKIISENLNHANEILKSLKYDTKYLQYFSDLIGVRKS